MANVTKKEIEQMLVAERKKSRLKEKHTRMMAKTLNIYRGQQKRAAEMKQEVPFTLEEFREFFKTCLQVGCYYTDEKLTLSNITVDHKIPVSRGGNFSLFNLAGCTVAANMQKGKMSEYEFSEFLQFLNHRLPPDIATDVKRRLTAGGKALARRF